MVKKEEEDGIMKKIIENIRRFTGNKIARRVCRYTGDVIIAVLLVLVAFSAIGNIQSKGTSWVVPRVGPYSWLTVLSGSMKPTFNPGDIIVDKKADTTKLKVGDVITYRMDAFVVTHRIAGITKDKKGRVFFQTKGDNNNIKDEGYVLSDLVVGKYLFRIPLLGFILQNLKGINGVICIWTLFVIIIGIELFKYIRSSKKQKKDETIVQ